MVGGERAVVVAPAAAVNPRASAGGPGGRRARQVQRWLGFVCRVLVGLVFVLAGASKLLNSGSFSATLLAYAILPIWAIRPLALALPWIELVLGLYLVAGLFARKAAWMVIVFLAVFSAAIGQALWRGIALDNCGCFGELTGAVPALAPLLGGASTGPGDLVRDGVYALMALVVARGPTTPLGLDERVALERNVTPGA